MSYELYFIGGPMDLTKQIKEGDAPQYDRLRVPEMQAVLPYPPCNDDRVTAPMPRCHVYRIRPLGEKYPYRNERVYAAIWDGIER